MGNTNNKDFMGSLHHYNIETHIELIFKDFFDKHKISKTQSVYYKNKNAELYIGASDHRYIDLTFRKVGKEDWYKLNFYLEAKLGVNDISLWSVHSCKYSYSNLDEFAEAFIKFHSTIAEKYLNEPFENDFTWEAKYNRLQEDYDLFLEIRKSFPEESILYKMYFDRKVRDHWRLLAREKLGINN